MAEKVKLTDKLIKTFIKRGGRSGAKSDFNNVLRKATKSVDKSR